jgi:hypothetical protein
LRKYPKLTLPRTKEINATSPNFVGGLNKFVTDTHIQDNEVSDLLNAKLTEDGVISKRDGQVLKLTQGSRITGVTAYYPSSGIKYVVFTSGQALYKTSDLSSVTRIGALNQYTDTLRTEYAQYNDFLYVLNGVDPLTKTDGTNITVFSHVNDPSVSLTLATVGTAGTTTYAYRYSWVTNTGETNVGAETVITTGNATLDNTNKINVSLNTTTPANTVGLNLYGRFQGKETFMQFIAFPAGTVVNGVIFTDTGLVVPSTFFGVPLGNNTSGQLGKYIKIYKDSLIIAGDPNAKTRLYFSGGGDKIDSFLISDGGGFIEVNRNGLDGVLTGMEVWQDKLIVTKERSIWQFTFSSAGSPSLASIQPLHGCVDQRTLVPVENDLMMLSQISGKYAIMTLGFEPNFFNIIRTNQISIKISPLFDAVNPQQIQNACAAYFDFKYILSVPEGSSPTNNVCFVFDRRYNAHLGRWTNITANGFAKFSPPAGPEILLYGSDNSGGLVQLGLGTSDMGSAITFKLDTKNYNFTQFFSSKFFIDVFYQFRNLTGLVNITLLMEDSTGQSSILTTSSILQNVGQRGWGTGKDWGLGSDWGDTLGPSTQIGSSSVPIRQPIAKIGRGIKFEIMNTGVNDQVGFMALFMRGLLFSPYYFPQSLTITGSSSNVFPIGLSTEQGQPILTEG